jgi:selenocysteine lyase/cysteine desulfurase
MSAIQSYERTLSARLLALLTEVGAVIYGVKDPDRLDLRVPTFCFNLPGQAPAGIVEALAEAGFGLRDGHMYAPRLMARLGLSMQQGAMRASLVHYNTIQEIDRLAPHLKRLAGHAAAA